MDTKTKAYADPPLRSLILRAQRGEQEACDALRCQFAPLITSMVRQFSLSCHTEQEKCDLADELDAVFLNAISSYDTAQEEVSFGLYAKVCLHHGAVSELRHLEVLRRLKVVPLTEMCMEREDVAAGVAADDSFNRLRRTIQEALSEYEREVWWAYVAGEPIRRIAARLGKEEKSVYNAIYRIRCKLRTRLESERG